MTPEVLTVLLVITSCLSSSFGDMGSKKHLYHIDIPVDAMEAMVGASSSDLKQEKPAPTWRFWRPWKFWQWSRSLLSEELLDNGDLMESASRRFPNRDKRVNNEDSKRTLTRRDSSLIIPEGTVGENINYESRILRGYSTACTLSDAGASTSRPYGSVEREIVSLFFESMLTSIVESWNVISKKEEAWLDLGRISTDTISDKKKKSVAKLTKQMKMKKSISRVEMPDNTQLDPLQQCWWSCPDERAIIQFRNGNLYEGDISMKCMHGEGRFQWADGTVYLGHFQNNAIHGQGKIQWKDDKWYEGEFFNNFRHGKGIYVDSRQQCSYMGQWNRSAKHGVGTIYYSSDFTNLYDGEWNNNVRHGFGAREYCPMSGYKGTWDNYIQDGKGLLIWPNHDLYRGEWKDKEMSGSGIYIWNAFCSNSMSSPSICAYYGTWNKGKRHGYGILNFGYGLGAYYKGQFKKNKKHGTGKLVTNNGLILKDRLLFIDDNIGALNEHNEDADDKSSDSKIQELEPFNFDICNRLDLQYHIHHAFHNIDRQSEIRNKIINDYYISNGKITIDVSETVKKSPNDKNSNSFKDWFEFEISSLQKALMCHETFLRDVYYKYATICNNEEIYFTPVLIRLYLWQLYYDCNIHEKGLTLAELDDLVYKNPDWLAKTPHNPFEEIYFWQFLHSLVTVASYLYAKRHMPDKKPDTIVANAFRFFMEEDIIPGFGRKKGRLVNGYGAIVPLKGLYDVYLSLGEPCTIRSFINAIRHPPHQNSEQYNPTDYDIQGRNTYVFENEMFYTSEYPSPDMDLIKSELQLLNFNNVPTKTVIKIFSLIFPQIYQDNKVVNLMIELTFFEFFEAFIACAEESVRISDAQNASIVSEQGT